LLVVLLRNKIRVGIFCNFPLLSHSFSTFISKAKYFFMCVLVNKPPDSQTVLEIS